MVLNPMTGILVKRDIGRGHVKMEAEELGVLQPWPRDLWSYQKLEEARQNSPYSLPTFPSEGACSVSARGDKYSHVLFSNGDILKNTRSGGFCCFAVFQCAHDLVIQ